MEWLLLMWTIIASAMSATLATRRPHLSGWGNVSRSIAWPVTIYEIHKDLL